jgi:hypothetical protein
MRVVIAFDIDGCVETSSGPVKVDRMKKLAGMGCDIWIVSPSGLSPNRRTTDPTNFPESINGDRLTNLLTIKNQYPPKPDNPIIEKEFSHLFLYVSDNKDYDIAKQAGYSYIEASQFV